MENLGTIEENSDYKIVKAGYKDTVLIFRYWFESDLVEVEFSDAFAQGNGFVNISDMLDKIPILRYQINMYCNGIIPEWIAIIEGQFMIKTNMMFN